MKTKPILLIGVLGTFATLMCIPAQAKLAWNKKARAFDPGVTSCLACHVNKKPKKDEPLAERGKWLMEQKEKRQAKEMDLSWLKDYPNNGK